MESITECRDSTSITLPVSSLHDKSLKKKRFSKNGIMFIVSLSLLTLALLFSVNYFTTEQFYLLHKLNSSTFLHDQFNVLRPSFDEILNENFQFDIRSHDVLVFLHIQKTGGTFFGSQLVHNLYLESPCVCHRKKRCQCFRPGTHEDWLFSRYSTGWKCGLHADWTELISCVDSHFNRKENKSIERRYFYMTILREPISRYLSEYLHVRRGATWRQSRHWCGFREATLEELPRCYSGDTWEDVTLSEFLACPFNLANNRQVRMLADLTKVGCYNRSFMPRETADRVMLNSAKMNLAHMAFFGLTEFQQISQYLFEETFNLRFVTSFQQYNSTRAAHLQSLLTRNQLELIMERNALDLELYRFARELFFNRFEHLKQSDHFAREHFYHVGLDVGVT